MVRGCDPRDEDRKLFDFARDRGLVIFTHDLDFGAILAATGARSPSVLQLRTQDVTPKHLAPLVIAALSSFAEALAEGALVTIDEKRQRARILPTRALGDPQR